jgi:hypothetical protein
MASSLELATTIVRKELGVIENMNHFCRFLLKCGVKAGKKLLQARVEREHSNRISNSRRYCAIDDSEQHRPGPLNVRKGSIPVVERIGAWVFQQASGDVSVHASTLRESHRPRLQTPW